MDADGSNSRANIARRYRLSLLIVAAPVSLGFAFVRKAVCLFLGMTVADFRRAV